MDIRIGFKVARARMMASDINTQVEFQRASREGRLPEGIPSNPNETYKDEGWISWRDFLCGDVKAEFLPFEEAREIMMASDINTQVEFQKASREGRLPEGIPSAPNVKYKDEGWISCPDFLRGGSRFLPFGEAREVMMASDINTQADFKKASREGRLPVGIPSNPNIKYKDEEWISWGYFLRGDVNAEFLPFGEARARMRASDINAQTEFRKASREGRLSEGIPSHPYEKYKNEGWFSWGDFLRGEKKAEFLPFGEAREVMMASDINTQAEFKKASREGRLPEGIPSAPNVKYKDEGWIGMPDFLRGGSRFLPFEEAREVMMASDINTVSEFNRASREGRLPEGIPSSPERKYKDEEWISWGDFLRGEKKAEFLPFGEAREVMMASDINTQAEFQRASRDGLLPGIPSSPERKYKDEGWVGMSDFLRGGSRFLPFGEAREVMMASDINTDSEFKKASREGRLPEGIPSSPERKYKNEGWIGMPDFLRGEKKAEFLPCEEARARMRASDINTQAEFKEVSREGRLPEGIPGNPRRKYKDEGWVSWSDFLRVK